MIELEISNLVKDYYGLDVQVKSLDSYIDLNFKLTDETGISYVLKLHHHQTHTGHITAQNQLLVALQQSDTLKQMVPSVIPTKNNKLLEEVVFQQTKRHMRLLTYLEGELLIEVDKTKSLLNDLGIKLAQLDIFLARHNDDYQYTEPSKWDLQYFHLNEIFLEFIPDPDLRTLVDYYILQFHTHVSPELTKLRKSLIHNDANDQNLLVSGQSINGIIDFGDMVYSPLVNELAVCLAYAAMDVDDPIEVCAEVIKSYHSVLPLLEIETDLLYYLLAGRLCVSILNSSYSRKIDPENSYISSSEKSAIRLLTKWLIINPHHAQARFRNVCGLPELATSLPQQMLDHRYAHMSKALSVSYEEPLIMERAAMQYMYDAKGDTYLDCVNNIMHVGHCHPHVVRAGQRQMAILNTNTRYLYDSLNRYAKRLSQTFPQPLNKVFFVNSGSAASDLALRLAKTHTSRKDLVVVDHAYHGNTSASIELSPYKYDGKGGQGGSVYVHKVMIPDTFRGEYRSDNPAAASLYAQDVSRVLREHPNKVAGFICESIIGCGGQVMLPDGYLTDVYQQIRADGGVCIADEVQVGFGRIGSHMWAFELSGVVPDIVIIGKPMGNGHPIAAVVTTDEIAESFENGMEFFSSFGGNPVSCEVANAVLDVIENENLQEKALQIGDFLIEKLLGLQQKYPLIGEIRGKGLFLGVELIRDLQTLQPATTEAASIIQVLKRRGILLSTDGPYNNVLKFKPPMQFNHENAIHLIDELDKAFKSL